MPAPDFQETPDDDADDSDHEERAPTESVPQSSSSHWEWRPEYEVPPPEPGDPGMTRRRIVAKRPPTDDEEEMRQKRLRSESVPELFPLTGEELSEDVLKSWSIYSRHLCQTIVKIPMCQLAQNFVMIPVFRKLMCTLWIGTVPDHRSGVWKCQ